MTETPFGKQNPYEQNTIRFLDAATRSTHSDSRSALALTSIAASLATLVDQFAPQAEIPESQTDRDLKAALAILGQAESDQPEHYIRWLRAFLDGREFPVITPEEPEPGRDWTRVQGHLFKPSGKWGYKVWLDYTGERHTDRRGEGPAGWHFDGGEMAKRALARATANGTSGVTISHLGTYWHLFVPDPPQGFPHWVQPEGWNNDPVLAREQEAATKLDGIRSILGSGGYPENKIEMIQGVLDG